jgi:hypothetical protein
LGKDNHSVSWTKEDKLKHKILKQIGGDEKTILLRLIFRGSTHSVNEFPSRRSIVYTNPDGIECQTEVIGSLGIFTSVLSCNSPALSLFSKTNPFESLSKSHLPLAMINKTFGHIGAKYSVIVGTDDRFYQYPGFC